MNTQQSIEIRVSRHICQVDSQEWDSIIDSEDLQMTHRFVRVCQESGVENARYWHLVFYRGGRVEAVACLSTMTVSLELLSTGMVRGFIRAVRHVLHGFLKVPVLFCGLPVSFGRSSIRFHSDADKEAVVRLLAEKMEDIANQEGIQLLCFKEFFEQDLTDFECLYRLGYFSAPSIPFCRLMIRWKDFSSYLASLRASYRRHIKKTLLRGDQTGLQIQRVEDFKEINPEIFRLYEQTMDRAQFQLERLNRRFFENINSLLGSESCVLVARHENRIVSTAVLLQAKKTMTFLLAGIDYQFNRQSNAYINLVIRILDQAIEKGAEQLDLAQTSYFLKRSLGAEVLPVHIFLRHRLPWCNRLLRRIAPLLFPDTELPPMHVFR